MKTDISVNIEGMSCSGCANTVKEVLLSIESVEQAEVSHENDEARIQLADVNDMPSLQNIIKEKIEQEGYTVVDFS